MTGKPSDIFRVRVRRIREERGLSQAALGEKLGEFGQALGQSRIAVIEATGSVTLDQAVAIAEVLCVPVEVLLYEQPAAIGGGAQQYELRLMLDTVNQIRKQLGKMIQTTQAPGADSSSHRRNAHTANSLAVSGD